MAKVACLRDASGRWFVSALLLAAAIRLYLLWQYYCINSDGVVYLRTAQDFFAGDFQAAFGSIYPPGYPVVVAALFPLIGNWELTGQAISILCGVGLLFPLYWIFRMAFGSYVAVLACFLAAMSPFLALYSVHVRTESPYLLLTALALFFCLKGMESLRVDQFFLGGLVAGYAFLVRPEAIGFLAVIPAAIGLRWLFARRESLVWIASSVGSLCCGFAIFALPFIVYLSIDTGYIGALTRKAGVTLEINLRESGVLNEEESAASQSGEPLSFTRYIREHPVRYLKNAVGDLGPAIGVFFEALHYSYVPFLLVGLALVAREKFWAGANLLLLLFVCFYVFGFALIYVKRRYSLQAVPLSLGWVALGMWWVRDKLQCGLSSKRALASVTCVALIVLGTTLPKTLKPVSREKAYVREAGWYLKARNRQGDLRVAVLDDRITFYAESKNINVGGVDQAKLATILRERHAEYLAAEAKAFHTQFPIVFRQPESHGLVLEKKFIGIRENEMLVFRVI